MKVAMHKYQAVPVGKLIDLVMDKTIAARRARRRMAAGIARSREAPFPLSRGRPFGRIGARARSEAAAPHDGARHPRNSRNAASEPVRERKERCLERIFGIVLVAQHPTALGHDHGAVPA